MPMSDTTSASVTERNTTALPHQHQTHQQHQMKIKEITSQENEMKMIRVLGLGFGVVPQLFARLQ